MGEITFYAYKEGGSVLDLEEQFWEAVDYVGLKAGVGYSDTEGGDLTLYDVWGMDGNDARDVLDYLNKYYPHSHWEGTGFPGWRGLR